MVASKIILGCVMCGTACVICTVLQAPVYISVCTGWTVGTLYLAILYHVAEHNNESTTIH